MVDVETFGTQHNSVIRSIGVVAFTMMGEKEALMHLGVDIESCLVAGLHIDNETVRWWAKQVKDNKQQFNDIKKNSLENVLREFNVQVEKICHAKHTCMWSHGSNFDSVILENAYAACGIVPWWHYRNVRDTRTLFWLANYDYKAKGGHCALDDAMEQVEAVQEAYQQLIKGESHGKD